jgi:hypothetical protein
MIGKLGQRCGLFRAREILEYLQNICGLANNHGEPRCRAANVCRPNP